MQATDNLNGRQLLAETPEAMGALVQELERISKTKKDYVVPSTLLWVGQHPAQDGTVVATVANSDRASFVPPTVFDIGPVAHEQIAEKTDIPIKYYRRMLESAPELVGKNVNHWLTSQPKNYLIRTLDGRIRAMLSDKYWAIDNHDVFFHVAKTGRDLGAHVSHLALTDERLHIRLLQPDFKAKITGSVGELERRDAGAHQIVDDEGGDYVFGGIVARNSEVGRGGFTVEFVIYRAACRNLLVVGKSLRQVHLGGKLAAGEDGIVLTNETQEAKAKALWLEVRDMVTSAFTPEIFADIVARLNNAQSQVLDNPVEAVNAVVKNYGLPEAEKQLILNELINPSRGPNVGPTVWGLINAVTARAHERDADAGHDLSTIAGDLLNRELVAVR